MCLRIMYPNHTYPTTPSVNLPSFPPPLPTSLPLLTPPIATSPHPLHLSPSPHPTHCPPSPPSTPLSSLPVKYDDRWGHGFTVGGEMPAMVRTVKRTSPADQAGLDRGDYILKVRV